MTNSNSLIKTDLNFDSVVMLTWSNWYTELRSNRYHYATRFCKHVPVIFVQPDLVERTYKFEDTEFENIKVLHVHNQYNEIQIQLIKEALFNSKILRPIFWVYNPYFCNVLNRIYSVLNVYHGTEDYFSVDSPIRASKSPQLLSAFKKTFDHCQLFIAVSDGVKESFEKNYEFAGDIITVTNGCDYHFYKPTSETKEPLAQDVVFYQGNIFKKLDYHLLMQLAQRLPTWKFKFCGKLVFGEKEWKELAKLRNVEYLGLLSPEKIREEAYTSTVGIIPFVEEDWLVERSFPLKSFEYLACGLPVVSVRIKSLVPFKDVIQFAKGVDEFEAAILRSKELRFDVTDTQKRLKAAARQDYDLKFDASCSKINEVLENKEAIRKVTSALKVLILIDPAALSFQYVRQNLESLRNFSCNDVSYMLIDERILPFDNLDSFDVVILHSSIFMNERISKDVLPQAFIKALKVCHSYKILFLNTLFDNEFVVNKIIASLHIQSALVTKEMKILDKSKGNTETPDFVVIKTESDFFSYSSQDELAASVLKLDEFLSSHVYPKRALLSSSMLRLKNASGIMELPTKNLYTLTELEEFLSQDQSYLSYLFWKFHSFFPSSLTSFVMRLIPRSIKNRVKKILGMR